VAGANTESHIPPVGLLAGQLKSTVQPGHPVWAKRFGAAINKTATAMTEMIFFTFIRFYGLGKTDAKIRRLWGVGKA
jgi:hypothetical protein